MIGQTNPLGVGSRTSGAGSWKDAGVPKSLPIVVERLATAEVGRRLSVVSVGCNIRLIHRDHDE